MGWPCFFDSSKGKIIGVKSGIEPPYGMIWWRYALINSTIYLPQDLEKSFFYSIFVIHLYIEVVWPQCLTL